MILKTATDIIMKNMEFKSQYHMSDIIIETLKEWHPNNWETVYAGHIYEQSS